MKITFEAKNKLVKSERCVYFIDDFDITSENTLESKYLNVVLQIKNIFSSAVQLSSDRWYVEIQPLEFVYVPVISGAYASIAFTIPFYKVFDTDESHITDSMFPCRIENELAESIIRGKAHKKWIEAMQKIGVIKTYLRCYSQVLKVSVDEISCEILVGKLIDKATGQIVEFLEMMKLFFGCFDEINDCIASNSDPNEIIQAIDNVFTVMILLQQYVIEHDSE
jgi:hypothetical protein